MTITVEATYENGTLKLDQPLPLKEHEKVRITVQPTADQVARSNLTAFMRFVAGRGGPAMSEYAPLYRWSIDAPEAAPGSGDAKQDTATAATTEEAPDAKPTEAAPGEPDKCLGLR